MGQTRPVQRTRPVPSSVRSLAYSSQVQLTNWDSARTSSSLQEALPSVSSTAGAADGAMEAECMQSHASRAWQGKRGGAPLQLLQCALSGIGRAVRD